MDYSRNSKFKAGLFLIALMTMTACSSSQVDDGSAPPPETAGDAQAPLDASTDAVPPAADAGAPPVAEDPSLAAQPAPGALDANQPPGDPAALASAPPGDPSAPADAPPMGDPASLAPAPVADLPPPAPISDPVASAPAPAAPEAPMASTPVADTASAPTGEGVSYKVKRGDTLMKIAFENYGDLYRWKEIFEANRAQITDPNAVPPGTQLTLNGAGMVQIERNGERYLIKRGDTLGLISNDVYGTPKKWKKLWENNRQLIKNPNHIYAGFYLFYQPEARLTHDEEAPAVIDGGSAQNLPFKGQGQPAQNVAEVQPAAMQNAAPVNPAAPNDQRQPASKK